MIFHCFVCMHFVHLIDSIADSNAVYIFGLECVEFSNRSYVNTLNDMLSALKLRQCTAFNALKIDCHKISIASHFERINFEIVAHSKHFTWTVT